ncbi:MAG: HEAT repeat domain-containing protein [Minicystis sp.]
MGFFDFLKKKSVPPAAGGSGPAAPAQDKRVAGPAKVAGDKRAQTYDRMEALQQLADMKTPDAAAALLKRFTFSIDPSITDQDEKEVAFQGVIAAGKDVVPAVLEFCAKAEQLTWPLKVLYELLDDAEYEEKMIEVLDRFDTEYARNVEPKLQVIQALEEVKSEHVREAVEPFLEDVNETVRFHAVQTTFAQNNPVSLAPLVKLLEAEESVRVKNKVGEGLLFRGWVIPGDLREKVQVALRETAFGLGSDGKIVRGSSYH